MLKNIHLFATGALLALICCTALVGCGTKGPLYIPEQRYPQEVTPQEEAVQKSIPQDEGIKTAPEANTEAAPKPAP